MEPLCSDRRRRCLIRRYIGMGVRLVLGGGDLGFMTAAATERAKLLRDCRWAR